jgi:hypothetical protein
MYKNRITKWGFDKKNKEDEMKAIVKKKFVRAAIGKKSMFKLRGRMVALDDVERYMKRKLLSPAGIVLQASSTSDSPASTPNGLECITPPNVPASPQAPEIFQVPEHIFTMIRDYFLGSFGAGTWVAENEISDCVSTKRKGNEMVALKNLFSHHDVACQLLDKNPFKRQAVCSIAPSQALKISSRPNILGQWEPYSTSVRFVCTFEIVDDPTMPIFCCDSWQEWQV